MFPAVRRTITRRSTNHDSIYGWWYLPYDLLHSPFGHGGFSYASTTGVSAKAVHKKLYGQKHRTTLSKTKQTQKQPIAKKPASMASSVKRKSSSKSSGSTMTTTQKGDILEQRVLRILKNEGRSNIKNKLFLKDANGNRSEIDLCYGRLFKTYVECKNYSGRPVPLHDVAKFKEVLQLNNIPLSRGIFVTTSTYSPRATTVGVKTVDGKQLKEWETISRRRARQRAIRYAVCTIAAIATFSIHQAPFLIEVFALEKTTIGSYWLTLHESCLQYWETLKNQLPHIKTPKRTDK
eukprot:gb/GECG01007761.1/.p1 GENE.gb/GECG01007761.1/~~gb/GECG01007761.1/.p1  ORF type:complete len:292 (+),score=21.96 gb/GECG01007761.1/:1-876(+)